MCLSCGEPVTKKRTNAEPPRQWQPSWREVPGFKDWIILDTSNMFRVHCRVCDKSLGCTTTILKLHAGSKGHLEKCQQYNITVNKDFKIPTETEWKTGLAIGELKWAAMLCRMNLGFINSSPLAEFISDIDKNAMFRFFKVGATKVTNLITKVISPAAKEDLASVLRTTPFSLCVDESTDRSKEKLLAIVVRYTQSATGIVQTKMLEIPKVFLDDEQASSGAERIFDCVIGTLQKSNIPLENIIACCTDGCMTMVGEMSGFKARMREVIPHIIWIQCPAHKTHLCASHALNFLPKEIPKLVNSFHAMVRSANRAKDFENLQKNWGYPRTKFLDLSQSDGCRWPSV